MIGWVDGMFEVSNRLGMKVRMKIRDGDGDGIQPCHGLMQGGLLLSSASLKFAYTGTICMQAFWVNTPGV